MTFPLLSLLILIPMAVGVYLLLWKVEEGIARLAALTVTTILLLGTIAVALRFEPARGFHYTEQHQWLHAIGFEYHLALDGISLVFLLLTAIVFLMSLLASAQLQLDARYYGFLLLLQGGLLGTFTAQNFLHFFLFWELSLIPAFFLVKMYGGAQRSAAAIQFFIFTMVGSIAMLLAFLAIGLEKGTFDLSKLAELHSNGTVQSFSASGLFQGENLGLITFLLAFAGVAVKVPIWPLHSWLPFTYTQAPTPVTMVLTGIMSKMGVYGLIRVILPIFPREMDALHKPLLILAVITILYGAFAAFAQRDIKRLFAYSSLSHLGYCFLGVFAAAKAGVAGLENERAAAINGVVLQVLSHGLLAAALFGFVSFLERRNDGYISTALFGGLRKINPQFAALMGIALFASLGLPGLSGFPAEFLIFKGSFSFAPTAASFAVLGLLLTAGYVLAFFGQVFLGPLNQRQLNSPDLTASEKLVVLPAIALTFILGIAPQLVIAIFNPSVTRLLQQITP
jgi:NADH-quinone oxidoreductase subunit M